MRRRSGSEPATARSALTFRMVLAFIGLVLWGGAAVVFALGDWPVAFVVIAAVGAAVALADLVVVARRKARGEPG
jgi:hypothetical protein